MLDTFSDRFESERFTEHHHGSRELRALAPRGQPAYESAIDLQDVDWEAMKIRKRRISHAEIVDGEPHAQCLECPKPLQVNFRVVHDRDLGKLDHQFARVEAGDAEGVAHVSDQIRVLEMASGDVDRNP